MVLRLVQCIAGAILLSIMAAPAGFSQQARSAVTERFAEHDPQSEKDIDYAVFTEMLGALVYDVGRSDRRPAAGRVIQTGTRINRQNISRTRNEGNRVVYHLLNDGHREALAAYRADLESLPATIHLSTLNSETQLAYWLNLHNAVMLDELARAYPVRNPLGMRIDGTPLLDARIVNLPGGALTLNEIRHDIVATLWEDPRVIYGFYTGAIGGPSIKDEAFESTTVWRQLDVIGEEFVNSLRGVEVFDNPVRISEIYFEFPSLFPEGDEDLRRHLMRYADDEVRELISGASRFAPGDFDDSVADLTNGAICADTVTGQLEIYAPAGARFGGGCPALPPVARDLLIEVQQRRLRLYREGRLGRVTIRDVESDDPSQ